MLAHHPAVSGDSILFTASPYRHSSNLLPSLGAEGHVAHHDRANPARTAREQSPFFRLPEKIRLEIYRLCVPSGFVFDVREHNTFRGLARLSATPQALLNRSRGHFEQPSDDSLDDVGSDYEFGLDEDNSESESDGVADDEDDYSGALQKNRWLNATVRRQGWLPEIRSLLTASKRIREEVLDVLYGENVFRVIVSPQASAKKIQSRFSKTKVRRIRHLMTLYKQFETLADYLPQCRIQTFIRQEVIPNLTTLHIVCDPPTGTAMTITGRASATSPTR